MMDNLIKDCEKCVLLSCESLKVVMSVTGDRTNKRHWQNKKNAKINGVKNIYLYI